VFVVHCVGSGICDGLITVTEGVLPSVYVCVGVVCVWVCGCGFVVCLCGVCEGVGVVCVWCVWVCVVCVGVCGVCVLHLFSVSDDEVFVYSKHYFRMSFFCVFS